MRHARYPVVVSDDHYLYDFYSEGPIGRIRKAVRYEKIGNNMYNLAFGDWNEERSQINDLSRTNNGDRDRVLATVAYTALDFTTEYPQAVLLVTGSTAARTRLYQMGINNNWREINENFTILGYYDHLWEPFTPNRNYEAFLAKRK